MRLFKHIVALVATLSLAGVALAQRPTTINPTFNWSFAPVTGKIGRRFQTSLVIPAYYQFLDDEFDGPNGGLVGTRPNWTAPDYVSGSSTNPANWKTVTVSGLDFLYLDGLSLNLSGIAMYYGATQLAAVNDLSVDLGYDTSGINKTGGTTSSPNVGKLRIWQTDATNYLEVQLDTQNSRIVLAGQMAGVTVSAQYWKARDSGSLTFLSRGNLHVEIVGGVMRMALDGKPLLAPVLHWPFEKLDLTTLSQNFIAAGKNHGAVGLYQQSKDNAIAQYLRVKPYDVSINFVDQFVGRDSTTATGGSARLEMKYTGTANTWVGRLLDASTGAVVVNWARLSNGQQCASTYTTQLATLPTGISGAGTYCAQIFMPTRNSPYIVEAGFIGGDGLLHTTQSSQTVSGYKVQIYGQSTSNGRAATGVSAFGGTITGMGGVWSPCTNLTSAPCQTILTGAAVKGQTREVSGAWTVNPKTGMGGAYYSAQIASALLGAPVGIQIMGSDGTTVDDLAGVGGSPNIYTDYLAGANWAPGICELGVWDQGQANADTSVSTLATNYGSVLLNSMIPRWRAACHNPNMPIIISMIGRYATDGTLVNKQPQATVSPQRELIRQGYLYAIANDPIGKTSFSDTELGVAHPFGTGGTCMDGSGNALLGCDPYHYGVTGSEDEIGRRAGYSIAKALGWSGYDGRGPIITSATRVANVVTLHLNMNGATSLYFQNQKWGQTGRVPATPTSYQTNALYGYTVSRGGTNLQIDSMVVGADNITLVITLHSDPGGPVTIESYKGSDYDDNNLFIGTGYADGRGDLPVFKLFNDGSNLPNHLMTTPS
jgi:hypothetical protein